MNKKGQMLRWIFAVLIFVIVWFAGLGKFVNTVMNINIEAGKLSGVEAFFFAYFNLWIFLFLLIGILIVFYAVGGSK
jgi:hypothetical protein